MTIDEELTKSAAQRRKNQAAIALLHTWLADESGYDEAAWPIIQRAIEANRPSYRPRYSETVEDIPSDHTRKDSAHGLQTLA